MCLFKGVTCNKLESTFSLSEIDCVDISTRDILLPVEFNAHKSQALCLSQCVPLQTRRTNACARRGFCARNRTVSVASFVKLHLRMLLELYVNTDTCQLDLR